jgi:hypothetical protein
MKSSVVAIVLLLVAAVWSEPAGNRDTLFIRHQPPQELPYGLDDIAHLQEWERCPNGTHYIVKLHSSPYKVAHVVGCCPIGQQGAYAEGEDRILGCCPLDQAPVITKNSMGLKWLGCVDNVCQGGPNAACPLGKTYCRAEFGYNGGVCAPHAGDPCELNRYCTTANRTLNTTIATDAPRGLGTDAWHRWPFFEYNTRIWEGDDEDQIFLGHLQDPPVRVCNFTGMVCHADEDCDIAIIETLDLNNTTTVLDSEPAETYCCPDNHTVCTTPPVPTPLSANFTANTTTIVELGTFGGCANEARNETCCDDLVCPAQHKCCRMNVIEPDIEDVGFFNATARFCCPEQLECCYGDPSLIAGNSGNRPPPQNTGVAYPYCGMSVGGVRCAMDRWAPSSNYLLHRNRHNLANL